MKKYFVWFMVLIAIIPLFMGTLQAKEIGYGWDIIESANEADANTIALNGVKFTDRTIANSICSSSFQAGKSGLYFIYSSYCFKMMEDPWKHEVPGVYLLTPEGKIVLQHSFYLCGSSTGICPKIKAVVGKFPLQGEITSFTLLAKGKIKISYKDTFTKKILNVTHAVIR